MFNFDRERFLKIQCGAIGLNEEIKKVIDEEYEKGISSLFFLGSGGAGILMQPAEFIMRNNSKLPVHTSITAEFLLTSHKDFDKNSLVVLPSLSGTTEETIRVAEYCKEKGATTIALVGNAGTPLTQIADYNFVNFAEDDTSCESFYLQSYLIAFRLMYKRGEFPQYESVIHQLENVPQLLLHVKEETEERAQQFASTYKDETYHIIVGCGNSYPQAYYYGMCILEEMQWIKTRPVHAADFFHGTLELVEKDTSILLFKGEDETRKLTDRVQHFAEGYTNNLTIFDTRDYALEGISKEVRGYLSPIILATLLERVSCHIEKERNHPLTTRRYYRRVKY